MAIEFRVVYSKPIRTGWELTYRNTGYKLLPDNQGWGVQTQFQLASPTQRGDAA